MKNYSQQPEVFACQGEGEMVVHQNFLSNRDKKSCRDMAIPMQNPSADIKFAKRGNSE